MDPNVNFYEVQESFNDYWDGKEYERGKGWKQYKRWEYNMAIRSYPSGNRNHSKEYFEAWKQVKKMNSSQQKSNSAWQPVGPVSWESQGWNPGLGRINAIVVDPNDASTIYVMTPAGGLWKSIDAGSNWVPLTDNLPAIGASGLAIDPENSNILYLATGDGDGSDTYSFGVMKSLDGGESWEATSLIHDISDGVKCSKILMDPTDSDKLWVATNEGLFVTSDAGLSWTESVSENVRDIELKPGDPSVVYCSGRKFFKSTDGGLTFEHITDGIPSSGEVNRLAITVTADNPNLVYMVAGSDEDSGFYGLYRSSDSGDSWDLRSDSPNILTYSEIGDGEGGQSWYDLAIVASPNDEDEIYVGGINVWKSTNGGISWTITSHWVHPSNIGYTHADIHSLDAFGEKIYCGSDGGIFVSDDNGSSWTDLSEGLQISQFYRIAVSTTNPDLILTASQDNGTNLFSSPGDYTHLLGGDGNMALINYDNDQIMYSAYPGGDFQKSTNGGQDFSGFQEGLEESGAWVTPLAFHPTNPDILFSAFENVWKVGVNGIWAPISNFNFSGTLLALKVAPSDPDVIYTSTFGTITKTEDGGDNWTNISSGLPNLTITGIEIHPDNPAKIWITMSGYNANAKVFTSEDGGESWENITLNLPNIPVNCVAYQIGTDNGIYIGTDAGVYYKDATNVNWNSFNTGLPNVVVKQIIFQYQSSKVILGTFGRGVWTNDFFDPGSVVPVVNFSADKKLVCEGETVNYLNESINVNTDILWTFEGGTPAQSTDFSPSVVYNDDGNYAAKLWAQNENGADSLLLENYVTVISQQGIPAPYSEDFETANSIEDIQWYLEDNGDENSWSITNVAGFESATSLWVNNFINPPLEYEYLNSTSIDLSEMDTALVTMRVAYARRPNSSVETFKVFISNDCGESWTFKKVFSSSSALNTAEPTSSQFVPSGIEEWQLLTIDNIDPDERTENFRIRLEFKSNGGNNIYVDDINIIEEIIISADERESLFESFNLFPNPGTTQTTLNLNSKVETNANIELYDTQGRKVANLWFGKINQGANSILLPLKNVAQGVYTLSVITDLGTQSTPFVISQEN